MKHPLQALLIAPSDAMRRAVLTGDKEITIREGHRDYRPGPVMLCCHLEPWAVMADVVAVRHCKLREVSLSECQLDGFADGDALLAGLKRFYPNITWESPATVIYWEKVRGKLVDSRGKAGRCG